MIIEKNFSLDKIDYRKYSKKYNSYELIVPFENLTEDPKNIYRKLAVKYAQELINLHMKLLEKIECLERIIYQKKKRNFKIFKK